MVQRALGVDLGDRRVGVAKTDPSGRLASPLTVIERTGRDGPVFAEIGRLVQEWDIEVIVVGLPLSLDGSTGPAARKALARIQRLRDVVPVPVVTCDERMTTTTAARLLHDSGLDGRRQRGVIDKVAAAIILQTWIDQQDRTDT